MHRGGLAAKNHTISTRSDGDNRSLLSALVTKGFAKPGHRRRSSLQVGLAEMHPAGKGLLASNRAGRGASKSDMKSNKLYLDFFLTTTLSATASSAAPPHRHTADSLRISV